MKKPVAILGCGPAGLMAAWAVKQKGLQPIIFSKPEKSKLGGAQFLHAPMLGINDAEYPDTIITYKIDGDPNTYAQKVYGDPANVPFVSMEGKQDGDQQPGWNLGKVYHRLWEEFASHIEPLDVSPQSVEGFMRNRRWKAVMSTVPLPALCLSRAGMINELHRFTTFPIFINPEPYIDMPDNTIWYDGTRDHSWYRASRIFGVPGVEWSGEGERPPIIGLVTDNKPIATTCTCWPDVVRLGRRGTWTKGVLTHDAYFGALKVL